MVRINIVREQGKVFFKLAAAATATDRVFWCNMDPQEDHHICLFPNEARYNLKKHNGEPPATTPAYVIESPVGYCCRHHPEERGTLPVLLTS